MSKSKITDVICYKNVSTLKNIMFLNVHKKYSNGIKFFGKVPGTEMFREFINPIK